MNIPRHKKEKLLKNFEKITKNVSKKPIYILKKTPEGYSVVHYITGNHLVTHLPYAKTGKELIKYIIKEKKVCQERIKRLNRMIDNYYKHLNDAYFYKHTLKTTKDTEKVIMTEARLDITMMYLRGAREQLNNF